MLKTFEYSKQATPCCYNQAVTFDTFIKAHWMLCTPMNLAIIINMYAFGWSIYLKQTFCQYVLPTNQTHDPLLLTLWSNSWATAALMCLTYLVHLDYREASKVETRQTVAEGFLAASLGCLFVAGWDEEGKTSWAEHPPYTEEKHIINNFNNRDLHNA